jgi:hypothetical protein
MPISRVHDEEVGDRLTNGLREIERKLQPDVIRVRSSFRDDWSGDPAIFFRIVLSDEAGRTENLADLTGKIGARIFEDLGLAKLDYVPYFNFRSESEQRRLQDPEWD